MPSTFERLNLNQQPSGTNTELHAQQLQIADQADFAETQAMNCEPPAFRGAVASADCGFDNSIVLPETATQEQERVNKWLVENVTDTNS